MDSILEWKESIGWNHNYDSQLGAGINNVCSDTVCTEHDNYLYMSS